MDEMNDVQMMMWGWGDRAWWVIESVFLRSPNKGFWACLGDIPPDMPRRPEIWVSLCNLMLKLCGISRSYAILGSDSPQGNNRKDNSHCLITEGPSIHHMWTFTDMYQDCKVGWSLSYSACIIHTPKSFDKWNKNVISCISPAKSKYWGLMCRSLKSLLKPSSWQ